MTHPNLAAIRKIYKVKEEMICGSVEKMNIYFDYFKLNMQQDIGLRTPTNRFYTEKEAWEILKGTISVLAYLNKNGIFHGDITPSAI